MSCRVDGCEIHQKKDHNLVCGCVCVPDVTAFLQLLRCHWEIRSGQLLETKECASILDYHISCLILIMVSSGVYTQYHICSYIYIELQQAKHKQKFGCGTRPLLQETHHRFISKCHVAVHVTIAHLRFESRLQSTLADCFLGAIN